MAFKGEDPLTWAMDLADEVGEELRQVRGENEALKQALHASVTKVEELRGERRRVLPPAVMSLPAGLGQAVAAANEAGLRGYRVRAVEREGFLGRRVRLQLEAAE